MYTMLKIVLQMFLNCISFLLMRIIKYNANRMLSEHKVVTKKNNCYLVNELFDIWANLIHTLRYINIYHRWYQIT